MNLTDIHADGPTNTPVPSGGAFLLNAVSPEGLFSVEDFGEEELAMAETAQAFMQKEVIPAERRLETKEAKDDKEIVKLLKKAGRLGIPAVEVPDAYDGLGSSKALCMLMVEKIGQNADFSVTYGAHIGIGTAPILYFGTEAQRKKWLPKIASCEVVSAYALSEPGSGSDALSARCTATLNPEGTHYLLNGTKQWISNGAFADVFIVFAKVDGTKFTGFIVERNTPGFALGNEEHKLGIRGSSTRALIFDNAPVPVSNVLGEIGKGHKIAFNTLNLGRFKLGVGVLGGAKRALRDGLTYASERKQFNTRVCDFGAIREMVANAYIGIYAMEAMTYRIAGYMDRLDAALDHGDARYIANKIDIVEEYTLEDSIAKVFCSETAFKVVDDALQWYGGYGFVEDYPVEKMYRDIRVNRIFEGTNEINRMIIPGTLLKRVMGGKLDVFGAVGELEAELSAGRAATLPVDASRLAREVLATQQMKKLVLVAMQAATTRHGMALDKEQETLVALANLIIDVYGADSVTARTLKRIAAHSNGHAADAETRESVAVACTKVFVAEALDRVVIGTRRLLDGLFAPDAVGEWQSKVDLIAVRLPVDAIALRRVIAAQAVEDVGYKLGPQD